MRDADASSEEARRAAFCVAILSNDRRRELKGEGG
jgi:hypothetical protein